jgi:hypothetical protein
VKHSFNDRMAGRQVMAEQNFDADVEFHLNKSLCKSIYTHG